MRLEGGPGRAPTTRDNDPQVLPSCVRHDLDDDAVVYLSAKSRQLSVCRHNWGLSLKFENPKLTAKIEVMLTPGAWHALELSLGRVVTSKHAARALGAPPNGIGQPSTEEVKRTTVALPAYTAETLPVVEDPNPSSQWKKCVDGPVSCGLLHDLMSREWGKFR